MSAVTCFGDRTCGFLSHEPGAGENTLRRLALFVYLDYPTKNDVTSGKKASRAAKSNFNMA